MVNTYVLDPGSDKVIVAVCILYLGGEQAEEAIGGTTNTGK
jgi:hypothetical protein